MANHQHCTLTIKAVGNDPSLLQRVREDIKSEEYPFDFRNVIPEPNMDDSEQSTNLYRTPLAIWREINWGSDIGCFLSVEHQPHETKYCFDTLWAIPYKVILALIQKYPLIHIDFYVQEEMSFKLLRLEHYPGEPIQAESGFWLDREGVTGKVVMCFTCSLIGDVIGNFSKAWEEGHNAKYIVYLVQGRGGCRNYMGEWNGYFYGYGDHDKNSDGDWGEPKYLAIETTDENIKVYYSHFSKREQRPFIEFT